MLGHVQKHEPGVNRPKIGRSSRFSYLPLKSIIDLAIMDPHVGGLPEGAVPIYDESGSSGLHDAMESALDQVFSAARKSGNGPKTFSEDVAAFTSAVHWNEKWICALIAFHIVLWILTVWNRKLYVWQCVTFFFVCALVWSSERLNSKGINHLSPYVSIF